LRNDRNAARRPSARAVRSGASWLDESGRVAPTSTVRDPGRVADRILGPVPGRVPGRVSGRDPGRVAGRLPGLRAGLRAVWPEGPGAGCGMALRVCDGSGI